MEWNSVSAIFEARGESVCAESGGKLIKLSDCKSGIDDSLRKLNVLSHFHGQLVEYDLILNRSGLAHDLSFDQLERLWIRAWKTQKRHGKKLATSSNLPVRTASSSPREKA